MDFEMKNMTKYEGEVIRIKCEITGFPLPQYTWFRDDIPIRDFHDRSDPDRISAKPTHWGSRLRISNLRLSDAGMYKCQGQNRFGREDTSGYLTIIPGPNPDAAKNPAPSDPSYEISHETDYGGGGGGGLPPGPDDSLDPWGGGGPDDVRPGPELSGGFCQAYRGAACSKFIQGNSIYVRSSTQQGMVEERLTAALTAIAASNELSSQCGEFAIPSLCIFAFPLCQSQDTGNPRPRQLCRDECEALESRLCQREFALVRSNPMIDNPFILPRCQTLPQMGTPESINCVRLGIPVPRSIPKKLPDLRNQMPRTHMCFNGTGQDYRGSISTTLSGHTCRKWIDSSPSQYFTSQFPGIGDHNFCRNPDNRANAPWCFTSNPDVPMEVCAVSKCKHCNNFYSAAEANKQDRLSLLLLILVPCIAVPVALILLLVIICVCRRHKGTSLSGSPGSINKKEAAHHHMELNAMLAKTSLRTREFNMGAIRFLEELGEGTFGKVYKGELLGYYGDGTVMKVAIKTLKENAVSKVQHDFRREVDLMSDLQHPHIVCLLGVCIKEHPRCMLFEYMANGDLHEYLNTHSPHSDVSVSDQCGEGAPGVMLPGDMIHVAIQVASGMEYLAGHRYVHRDLAARNILVGDSLTIKISDFGLSRDVYSSDYYRVQSKSLMPVRWMPPESILYGKFTMESDAWSFGVVLWEIYSFGLQPYYGYSNQEVIEMIRARQILPCPEDCPSRIYALMVECWHEMPMRRPSFKEIHQRLRTWKAETFMNPQMANQCHSSAHSGSSRSAHSHPSSAAGGPSNNTTATTLTSNGVLQSPYPAYPQSPQQPPYAQQPYAMQFAPPPPMPDFSAQQQHAAPPGQYPHYPGHPANNALFRRPSSPSLTSQRSSSLHSSVSPASSVSGHKGRAPNGGGAFMPQGNIAYAAPPSGGHHDMYIPQEHTCDV
ncbi:hypothetical protein CAPTEDRAFT_162027 [Capitella teleta]|uniref:Tyrosine-protein kinase receptor n=1 Tax=Capitella teleta TaxID=283909 RepID=R7V7W5_CAPTE|nr:hypothetical protein CAPTEDRAFT_162027 [Capitella teleta]|eukprot:ELU14629.1 hypothetical protein CAPTEDRAFT_162027 [Capitella teleta]